MNIATDVASAGAGIVHADNVAGATAALGQWFEITPDVRTEMGELARQLFLERFDFAAIARNLLPVFEDSLWIHKSVYQSLR